MIKPKIWRGLTVVSSMFLAVSVTAGNPLLILSMTPALPISTVLIAILYIPYFIPATKIPPCIRCRTHRGTKVNNHDLTYHCHKS